MPDTPSLMKIFLGSYTIVDRGAAGTLAIDLGNNVHIQIHMAGFPFTCRPGDKLPLFTYVPYNPRPIEDVITGKPPIE